MKRAYLATSYTWKSKYRTIPVIGAIICKVVENVRFRRVTKATAMLLESTGWNVFSPITHSHPLPKHIPDRLNTHTFWLNLDFDWISACDEMWVFMQPGWDTSYGVDREIKFCKKREIPVRFVNEDFTFSGEEPRIYVLPKAVR
jgi:hypothetical protein